MDGRTYVYKVYRDGVFAGTLDDFVISPFEYSQPINSSAVELELTLAIAFEDIDATIEGDALLISPGSYLVTENGDRLLINKQAVFNNLAIEPGNRLEVILFTDDDPSGSTKFDGIIHGIIPNFGGEDTVKIRALSHGYELDNFIINTGSAALPDQSQDTGSSSTQYSGSGRMLAQSFIPDVSPVSGVILKLNVTDVPASTQVALHTNTAGVPSASPISEDAIATREVTDTTMTEIQFTFISPITVTPGTTYWLVLQ